MIRDAWLAPRHPPAASAVATELEAPSFARGLPARFPDLSGRVAVVTGASRGIGAGVASMLARSGAAVALVARDANALEDMQERIWDQGGHAITAPADCTVPEQLREAAVSVAERLGPVSVLAAFAGGGGRPEPSLSMSLDTWNRVLAGDVTSTFATIQAFAPTMLQRGYGSIITMSSAAGRSPSQSNVAYAVAKAGVVMLTKHLAAEWAPAGVRVNCIAPSAVHNEKMDLAMGPEQLAEFGRSFPLGRVGEPVDVATATAFLASDAAGWITGVTLDMSGGRVIV